MSENDKQLSNPFSTGGGGVHFEAHVQASYVALMLTGGYAPCMPCWPIVEIKLQGKNIGYDVDDLIVSVENVNSKERRKLLGQVKHSVHITQGDRVFSEVIHAAWNDFKNPSIFSKNKDIIALITGPLSAADFHNVQWLLNQARHTKNQEEFYRNVSQANFSPAKSAEKLGVFNYHLKLANNNIEISKDEVYSFLNHFYLIGYDLGKEDGVVLSLLHSHISQYNQQYPHWIWSRIVDITQTWNQESGTITMEKLPDDLKEAFKQPKLTYIPTELSIIQPKQEEVNWNQNQHIAALVIPNLIGEWNEKNEGDIEIFNQISEERYSTWVLKAREILQLPDSPLSFKNGIWRVADRCTFWSQLGPRIFDQNLDDLKEATLRVLTEHDPSFKLPVQERFAASIHGKVLSHSKMLRKGMAESLALIGSRADDLINCSLGKAETTVVLAIREIFKNSGWVLWGSLNNLLPTLAEAAPNEFLDIVENTLLSEPCPFDELFSQEGDGITGSNYLTGLLWALESLAWDENCLVRVCVTLADLASHDPGGKWANRPLNSLTSILLPWFPQTMASIEKRKIAVNTLSRENPNIAWKLVISLLPNQSQVSSGTYKPVWRLTIPDDWNKHITNLDYWNQISFYADLAVSMTSNNVGMICELIDHLDNLPKASFNKFLIVLSANEVSRLKEEDRTKIWNQLMKFTLRHRRFSDAKWALKDELLTLIDVVIEKLAPSNPLNLYQHLFTDRDSDYYEHNGNWEEQREKLQKQRQKAIKDILGVDDIENVVKFVNRVESPSQVGHALGCIANKEIDAILLPMYLEIKDRRLTNFISSYIWDRYYTNGWSWVDSLNKSEWNSNQIGLFLSYLPFTNETWVRAAKWLGDSQNNYWIKTNVNPYQTEGSLSVAIDKLIEYERPHAAIDCLNRMRDDNKLINVDQCVRALYLAMSSKDPSYAMDTNNIVELIKSLQENPKVSADDLFRIEWAYLPFLDRNMGAAPKVLENRLANDPEFFCEIIRLLYRSKKNNVIMNELSEDKKAIAENAWRLIHEWRTPPGIQNDGSFIDTNFVNWLDNVKKNCKESGHLEVALITIGEVLIYSPPDINGLWINNTIAEALNSKESEDMRNGFRTGIFNSRGVHWVDPSGKPELELAEEYRQKADDVENAGYQRLAAILRNISDDYTREARSVIEENKTMEVYD